MFQDCSVYFLISGCLQVSQKDMDSSEEVYILYVKITRFSSTNLATCQQDVFATDLQQACQQVVTMLSFHQVAIQG